MERRAVSKKFIALIVAIIVISSAATLTFIFLWNPGPDPSGLLTVSLDKKAGADFASIQEAIDYADSGATVYVEDGNYEEYLLIDKPLTLKGESREGVVINGEDISTPWFISSNPTPLLTIENTRDVTVSNMTFDWIWDEYGHHIWICNVTNISVSHIEISETYGALWVRYCNDSVFMDNTFTDCRNSMIFQDSNDNLISHTDIIGDDWWALTFEYECSRNEICYNIFDSPECAYELNINFQSGPDNRFHHNNFAKGSVSYHPEWGYTSLQEFDDGNGEGNYWADYGGEDADGDGVGDTDLPWNFDSCPLMEPVEGAGVRP